MPPASVVTEADRAYRPRVVDCELDELLDGLPAVAIEGPQAVGKTATALRRARTALRLDDEGQRAIAKADPGLLVAGEPPVLIDEWQRLPESFDRVRRAVDAGAPAGSFLLTGSATPKDPPTHSVAGRIVRVRLRPMSLAERDIASPAPSPSANRDRGAVSGNSQVTLDRYVDEIFRSGFPGLRYLNGRLLRAQIDGYLAGIVDRDFKEAGRLYGVPRCRAGG
jgi:predicted AAA+ superfamily ATPase